MINAKQHVIQHIKGHNKKISKEYLENLTFSQLLSMVHPNDYAYFEKMLNDEKSNNTTNGKY